MTARPLIKALKATKISEATAQWGQFLRNHDELDLGRLTHDQRQAVFAVFAPDEDMQLYRPWHSPATCSHAAR